MAQNEATLLIRIKELGLNTLDKIKEGLGKVADAAKWVGAAVVGMGALAIANYREQEEAVNELNQAMINQGIYTGDLSKKYQQQASALQQLSLFGDETIIKAQAALQAQIGQREVTQDLTQAVMDLAQAQGMDLVSAAQLVGKSIGSSTNALARYGIEIDASASASEKMSALVDGLNQKFGGQAEAATRGLGSIKQLQNNFSDVLEVIGEKLSPVITAGAKALSSFVIKLGSSKDFLAGLEGAITFVTKGFFYLKNAIVGVGGVIGTTLAAAIESVSLLTHGQFSKAKEVAALGMTEVGNVIKESKATLDAELAMIDQEKALTEEAQRAEELARLQQAEMNKNALRQQEAAKELEIQKKKNEEKKKLEDKSNQEIASARAGFLAQMASLQSSSNSALAAIGKAAAIAQITISSAQAAADGFKWGMAMGGPPLASAFAGLAWAAGAAQIAKVSGVQLAEGGIVKATPGGVPAIIGEGGRDEAVIPLDDNGMPPGMGGVSITINGNLVGDEQSLYQLAKMLDPALLKLRQNNESVAFDTGVI